MCNVRVVCSAHRENGKCNSPALYKILANLNPEVIYEEISPSRFDAYYVERSINTLESTAVSHYSKNFDVEHIPVDSDLIPELAFKKELDYMFDRITEYSVEYYQLSSYQYEMAGQKGFSHLNGNQFVEIQERIHQIEEDAIGELGNEYLEQVYQRWMDFNQNRENEIVKNIDKHCTGNYTESLLIIGAEHRVGILEKAKNILDTDCLNWIAYNPDELT